MAPGQGRWLGSAPYMPGRRDHQPSQVLSMLSELCGQARVMEFPWREAETICVSGDVTVTPRQTAHERHQASIQVRTESSPASYEERPSRDYDMCLQEAHTYMPLYNCCRVICLLRRS